MKGQLQIATDDTDLAVEVARLGDRLGLSVEPRCVPDPLLEDGAQGVLCAVAPTAPSVAAAVRRRNGRSFGLCVVGEDQGIAGFALDLGVPFVTESRHLLALARMLALGGGWAAQTRGLPRAVRARFERVRWSSERQGGRFVMLDDGVVGWTESDSPMPIGEPPDVAEAGAAIRSAFAGGLPGVATIEGVDRTSVTEVLFGPPRLLSDPASKAALAPYGVPVPTEELCSSPSRAASEAARLGFPVKLSVASPDLRLWDHPDLVVPNASTATAVREGFRLLMSMAEERDSSARILGIHVSAESAAADALAFTIESLDDEWAIATMSRAGTTPRTRIALPTSASRIGAALGRIGVDDQHRRSEEALLDTLNRVAVFVREHRDAVAIVRLDPVALLVGGGAEVREASIRVTEVFERGHA